MRASREEIIESCQTMIWKRIDDEPKLIETFPPFVCLLQA